MITSFEKLEVHYKTFSNQDEQCTLHYYLSTLFLKQEFLLPGKENMKGDKVSIHEDVRITAKYLVQRIRKQIAEKPVRYVLSIAGESGSGKSALGYAIAEELDSKGIKAIVLGQDDYFVFPPKTNDLKRREDPDWLGPHVEVHLRLMDQNLKDAINGHNELTKPLVYYHENKIEEETISLDGVKVIIVEGTYTSLLKNVDMRVFIDKDWCDTLEHRQLRNRGSEFGDPFIENVLSIEHKIIAGHRHLADIIITKDNKVLQTE